MVNSQTIKEIIDALKIDTNIESVPNAVPVVEVNPKLVKTGIIQSGVKVTSGSVSIYTTPMDQDFYLNQVSFSLIKDAACDVATGRVTVKAYVGGISVPIANIGVITLTAQNEQVVLNFKNPIKIDRNTAITIDSNTYTAGIMVRTALISGYLDEIN